MYQHSVHTAPQCCKFRGRGAVPGRGNRSSLLRAVRAKPTEGSGCSRASATPHRWAASASRGPGTRSQRSAAVRPRDSSRSVPPSSPSSALPSVRYLPSLCACCSLRGGHLPRGRVLGGSRIYRQLRGDEPTQGNVAARVLPGSPLTPAPHSAVWGGQEAGTRQARAPHSPSAGGKSSQSHPSRRPLFCVF